MTEPRHFHSARKGSGSLRPFPIYPLYKQTVILSLDKPIVDCFLFRPRKRLGKRRKRSHTNVSNASVARPSTPSTQTPQRSFQWVAAGTHAAPAPNRAHGGSHAETGGVSDGGWYHYSQSVPHVHQHPRAGYQNGKFCRFWVLVGDAPEERRKPSEQRCVYARRGPAGLRDLFATW